MLIKYTALGLSAVKLAKVFVTAPTTYDAHALPLYEYMVVKFATPNVELPRELRTLVML